MIAIAIATLVVAGTIHAIGLMLVAPWFAVFSPPSIFAASAAVPLSPSPGSWSPSEQPELEHS